MTDTIRGYIATIKPGARQSYKNLTIFPVVSDYVIPFDYLTLDEALTGELIEVVEIDDHGSVPELKVVNKSDRMVLILDGEELVGAKQNRIVNTTILIPAGETVVIPVSCVEQGRWAYKTERFRTENRLAPSTLRAMKAQQVHCSVRQSGSFRSDQGAIWENISARASRRMAQSDSMAMSEIYEKDRSGLRDYLENFAMVDSQVGAIFVINGRVVGMDCFGKPETFAKTFQKLVESYAMDAIDRFNSDTDATFSRDKAADFIEAAVESRVERHPAVGLGSDCRLESAECSGFALAYRKKVLHLSVFAQDNKDMASSRRVSRRQ